MSITAEKTEHKEGYKKTELGWIPKEWKIEILSEVTTILLSNVDKNANSNEIPVKLCNYTDVYKNNYINNKINFMEATAKEAEIEKFWLKQDDVIITKDSEDQNDIGIPALVIEELDNVLCGYHLAILRPKQNLLNGMFLMKAMQGNKIRIYLAKHANGITRFGLTSSIINNIPIPLPPLAEQEKIAKIISSWDKAIEKTESLITAKSQLKKTLMQRLLTGNLRFAEFAEQKWEKHKLGEIFEERKETSKDIDKYSLFSLTIEKGLTEKTERYERSFLLKDKEENQYRLVYPNDILYNPMNIRFGAIARSKIDKIVCVSAYYNVMQLTKKDFNIRFFEYLFKSQKLFNLYESVATGSLLEKKRVHLGEFLKLEITCPEPEEQQKIAAVLNTCDKEIELLNKQLDALKEQKKGLMQKLLTGQIRVKLEE